jgi:type IV pilus assembly protein PilE
MLPRQRGFTLIEMLIVVAMIAILAAIALPNYRDYVTRGRLVEATAGLADARVKMEQYFQDNRSYPSGCVIAPNAPGANNVQLMALKNFTLVCAGLGASTYTVTANGNAGGPMDGFSYTIDQDNNKTSTFSGTGASAGWTSASPNNCWVIRKGGVC